MPTQKRTNNTNLAPLHVERSYGIMYLVRDMNTSKEFYSSLLGQSPSFESKTWTEFDLGDQNLCLCRPQNEASYGSRRDNHMATRAVLQVRDIDDFKQELDRLNISVMEGPEEVDQGPGRFLNVKDPDGNVIGFYADQISAS